ncbi:rho GTPase-activating protein 20-like [Anoplopoma fimbria]|uniref:rho GTPase-activating protein 20-like n=1 Tax=Anoplopoma fimbria TaxID=229290 RepID=UPI0023EB035A|nr:rho GTPase-activating protein 20-like [Anoplopoma fimbria]
MDNMSPQQRQDNKRRMKSQSYRRQSAPSLVITKALTRSKTLSRESFQVPVCPETCSLVQSYLSGSDRSLLLHGHAQLKTGMQTQDRHLFLFTDMLVIAKAKSANHFKLKAQVCVCEMWTAGCMDEVCEGSTNPERSFVMGWPTCNCVAMFSSAELKDRWLPLLKSRIREEKEKEEPKTIPLRVYGKGINTFAVTKTLPVSNSDSTNEVIRLALQQFSVIGNVKDYQLWVISRRDNAPYPLIGHEFPFSIQMSHVRHAMSQGGGVRDADGQRAMQVEQMQVYKQCQFIMKPRPVETLQVSAEWSHKPFKRRHSLITWAFWRGSFSNLNELSLATAPRGCLFGQPLSSVCIQDALPKPVMDMMAFLYHEGSWTRGIFRRPAGARAVRELRDSLDAGEFQLPLTKDHVFIIAGVFKDFLRSIPSSLFCCELHEEWMDVLEEEDEEEEQVLDIKRMICRLPKENALLLRYLFAMLHGIQGNAHENQMTTFNLSVCIAPSMLWPPGAPSSPEVEGEGTKRVCELVKFMIEHCQQILGEDPSSLYGGPPQRLNTDETGSESWLYPLTDSSYDSLENELDDIGGGSPGFCSRRQHVRPKTLQGSLDSILTFSDCDQDTDPDNHQTPADSPQVLKSHSPGRASPSQDAADTSSALELLSLDGPRRRRRRSAPAKFRPCVSGGTGGLSDEDEEFSNVPGSHSIAQSRGQTAAVEVSSPSLSSTPSSPAQTRSSPDSLDSPGSDGLYPTETQLPSSSPSLPSEPSTASSAGGNLDVGSLKKGSPPKEALNWGTLKGCRGLHPNSWLKKGRRLSLTQQDNLEKETEEKIGGRTTEKSHAFWKGKAAKPMPGSQLKYKTPCKASKDAGGEASQVKGRPGQEPHKPQNLRPDRSNTGGDAAEKEVNEGKQPSPFLFYKQSGPPLSLFKQHKSPSVEEGRLYERRGSEPGRQVVDRAPALTRARLTSDPGFKVSDSGSRGGTSEFRSCLSPNATKAVRDYFESHPRSNAKSSQQVTHALAESRREWLKICSEPTAEPDFDQLLFAEESYV